MNEFAEIRDDQIRVIGVGGGNDPKPRYRWFVILSVLAIVVAGVIMLFSVKQEEEVVEEAESEATDSLEQSEPALFEPVEVVEPVKTERIGDAPDSQAAGFTEIVDTVMNDIPVRFFIPHNAEMLLHVGRVDETDSSVVYVAQAADVRADNGGIVGAFVLKGEPLAWGLSKKGFCASINGKVTIGVADNTSLFEEATVSGGYFFRQYPLVKDGKVVENEPKGKSIRRAICDRQGEILMAETGTIESFHDFSQALVDLGVDQAVYLVGSNAYGWAVDENGVVHEFGEANIFRGRHRMPKNTNYIIWRKK
jgi:hypothetical protein